MMCLFIYFFVYNCATAAQHTVLHTGIGTEEGEGGPETMPLRNFAVKIFTQNLLFFSNTFFFNLGPFGRLRPLLDREG